MAKGLALRRRRARRRANRIHMGAADGGKGELIAVGRVVPEEFAGPRTAEGGGSRRAPRRYDGSIDEAGDHHAVASKARKLALERGRIRRAVADQDGMTFVVEPARSRASALGGAAPVPSPAQRPGRGLPHGPGAVATLGTRPGRESQRTRPRAVRVRPRDQSGEGRTRDLQLLDFRARVVCLC